jgi:DNA-binding HxlR family transcriptional regulator
LSGCLCAGSLWRPLDAAGDPGSAPRGEPFKDFLASPEGIPTNILTDRLKRLLEHQVVIQVSDAAGSRHLAYQLTEKGRALLPVVGAIKDWGLTWEKGART